MPFNYSAVRELRKRYNQENLVSLVKDINNFCKNNNLDLSISRATFYNWTNKICSAKTSLIDMLYLYARSKGYDDLEFYIKPPNTKE